MGEPIAEVGYLAGLCVPDGDDWVKIKVDANGYLYVVGTGTTGAMEVTQDTPGDLLIGQHQYTGSAWVKSNLLWGYNDRWLQRKIDTIGAGGTVTITFDAVSEGYVYVLHCFQVVNNGGASARNEFYLRDSEGIGPTLLFDTGTAQYVPAILLGEWVLKKDDYPQMLIYGTSGHQVVAHVWGYKMKINM